MTLQYQIDPLSGVEQENEQTVKTFSRNFTIKIKEGITNIPNVYIGDDNNKIPCSFKESFLSCETDLTKEAKYEIYYEGACQKRKQTGISINYVINKEIKIKKIVISNEDICTESPLTEFQLFIDSEPTKTEITAVMKVNDKEINFTCTGSLSNQEATCNQSTDIEEGTYELIYVDGNDKFSFGELENKLLKYKNDYLGDQGDFKEQTVNKEQPTVIIKLKDSNSEIPNVYSSDDEKSIINCSKKESTDRFITCYPDDITMPKSDEYKIYYKNSCDEMKETGITIDYTLFKKITVSKIYYDDDTQCSKFPLTQFKLLIDKEPSKEIKAILSNNAIFICLVDESNTTSLTCSTNESINEGNYSLSSVEGVDLFILDIEDNNLQFQTDFIEEAQITNQIVKKSSPTFTVKLKPTSFVTPNIYVGNVDVNNIIKCERKLNDLECKPNITNFPSTDLYQIFSDGTCNTIIDTGITVENILSKNITITDLFFNTGNKTCTESSIDSFTMSINSQLTGYVYEAVLKQDNHFIHFSSCSYTINTITCSEPSIDINEGFYSLYTVSGDDNYTVGDLSLLEYHINPFGEQSEMNPIINKDTHSFDIVLSLTSVEAPVIYVGNDANKKYNKL